MTNRSYDPLAKDNAPEPPEELAEQVQNLPYERPIISHTGHAWRQRGLMVECDSCDYPHGFRIDQNQLLTGIDDLGYPKILTHRR